MITGIAHACFTVSDLDASIAWYEKLGLRPAFDFLRDSGERFGVYLHVGGRSFVELFVGEVKPVENGSYRHICLEVDDIESTVGELRARQVEVSDPKLGSDRSWQAWVTDPDGNRIELHQYTPESRQTPFVAGQDDGGIRIAEDIPGCRTENEPTAKRCWGFTADFGKDMDIRYDRT